MISSFKEAYSIENLRRAWRWLNTNTESQFKNYFRNIYRAYAIAAEENLLDLQKRLLDGTYRPTHATKLYFPKKSGIQRTFSLLTVEDQIVYQALVGVIADRFLPKIGKQYYQAVFGNIYAGKRSRFFYKDWRFVYGKFSSAIRAAYNDGFQFAASFDLTACYDSIDHSVLRHFLDKLGLEKEFVDCLVEYLQHWSITDSEDVIRQGHGIPQGPLASGLLAEVVLNYFDEKRPKRKKVWRYFRYVDDIRFLAKDERSLRRLLVAMDLLSKQIGLFPQSAKVDIHKIQDIDAEIKSVFYPQETEAMKPAPNQKLILERLIDLSPQYKVSSETRFKYVLGSAQPSSKLAVRLLRILAIQPHLYMPIFNYFGRYKVLPPKLSTRIITLLKSEDLYPAFVSSGLRMLLGRCHSQAQPILTDFCKKLLESQESKNPELVAAAAAIVVANHAFTHDEMQSYVFWKKDWWTRTEIIRNVQPSQIGVPSYQVMINSLLCDEVPDVSLTAAELLVDRELSLTIPTSQINSVAQLSLVKMGYIGVRRGGKCPISSDMQAVFGNRIKAIVWKDILGRHYDHAIPKAARIRACSSTDASSWINLVDTLHDDLLDALYNHDPSIGGYTHGKLGSVLNNPSNHLGTKYPNTYRAFFEIHETRLKSDLSHSVVYKTKRRTRAIPFRYIGEVKNILIQAYLEIANKW